MGKQTTPCELRASFAARLSALYSREVPAYAMLLDVAEKLNTKTASKAEHLRLGSLERVHAERHGAIRVGSSLEMAQVARIFAAIGMHPVGYYDLRDTGVPVVSTAFRPIGSEELEANPFRVFTSLLALSDPSYFAPELASRVENFLGQRQLFAPMLLALAERALDQQGLNAADAETFLTLAISAFQLTNEPIDRAWYSELSRVSAVAADIAGVSKTHINHLTPRVLDIDALWSKMTAHGVEMIPEIQGPPRWDGPDVLLRQTSFKALAEQRVFREPDGQIATGDLRVRFGEVEARGIALTEDGFARYDTALQLTDRRATERPEQPRDEVLRQVWAETFPRTEAQLISDGLAAFTVKAVATRPRDGKSPTGDTHQLIADGFLTTTPIVYEDFLPRSAAGIFRSNLSEGPRTNVGATTDIYGSEWMQDVLQRELRDPHQLYEEQSQQSLDQALHTLEVKKVTA